MSLVGRARSRPDLVKQVIDKSRRKLANPRNLHERLDQPMALGYLRGTIIALVSNTMGLKWASVWPSQAAVCMHAEYALCRVFYCPHPE